MSRRHKAEKREVNPDPKFGDLVVSKFMNSIMKEGKKSVAENIVYGAHRPHAEPRAKSDPIQLFHSALENVMPAVEVRSRRVGGATYQVPVEVRPERRQALAIRWLIAAAREPQRKHHGGAAFGRAPRCREQPRHGGEKAGGHAQDGRGEPRLLPLPLVNGTSNYAASTQNRGLPQLRHHGPHRCREDHDDRADPLLHGQDLQDRRGARRRRDHGFHGAGAGARHHHHVGRHHLLLGRQAPQHHRHARPRRLHHRGGALAARARRRRVRARRQPGRRAADRDGLAPGRQVRRAAHHLRQQDG